MNHFDFIILICPTFSWNKTYQQWKYNKDPDLVTIECVQEHVDKILHVIQTIKYDHKIVISQK